LGKKHFRSPKFQMVSLIERFLLYSVICFLLHSKRSFTVKITEHTKGYHSVPKKKKLTSFIFNRTFNATDRKRDSEQCETN